jgi:hypothetical protein
MLTCIAFVNLGAHINHADADPKLVAMPLASIALASAFIVLALFLEGLNFFSELVRMRWEDRSFWVSMLSYWGYRLLSRLWVAFLRSQFHIQCRCQEEMPWWLQLGDPSYPKTIWILALSFGVLVYKSRTLPDVSSQIEWLAQMFTG